MEMSKNKILITGCFGAIGYWLVREYLSKGYLVTGIDNFSNSSKDSFVLEILNHPSFIFYNIDLCNESALNDIEFSFDYVYHFAALNGTQNFYEKSFTVLTNSTLPTLNILSWAIKSKNYSNTKFIYAGSSESYASTVQIFDVDIPTKESVFLGISNPKNPRWSYAASKLHGEIAFYSAYHQHNLNILILRFHNIYGPRMGTKHVIPDFINRVLENKFELYGADDTRSFLYVKDAAKLAKIISEKNHKNNDIVNLGSNKEISILNLAKLILEIMGIDQEITIHPSPQGSVKRRCPNIDYLMKIVEYFDFTDLSSGLADVIKFIRENKI